MTLPRRRVDEWMDDPELDAQRHRSALAGLRRLNRLSRVSSVLYPQLARLAKQTPDRPLQILDVASGSADLPIDWIRKARRQGISLKITALDRSETALATASESATAAGVTLGTIQRDCLADRLPSGFDVVTCSLFMHHLDDDDAIKLVHQMWRACRRSILICDLDRSRINVALVGAAARIVSRSEIVHHDSIASVRGAYTRSEFESLLERSLGFHVPVRRSLPCRFLAVMDQACEVQWAAGARPAIAGAIA